MRFHSIVVLTGAGLSAESGLGTFRDQGGLWSEFNLEEVATPEGFARNPARVHEFYNLRRRRLGEAQPNAAHRALARLEREHRGQVLTVTQNIDPLHEAAGTKHLIHMHGELARAICAACGTSTPWKEDLSAATPCTRCGEAAMRPDVVWFGEMPREMDRIYAALVCLRPVHFHRHERQRLSRGRLRGRGAGSRRSYGRAQSRTLGGREPVRRGPLRPGHRNRPRFRRPITSG